MKKETLIECEQKVLGALLLDSTLYPVVSEIIGNNDFMLTEHQIIFDAMGELFETYNCFSVPEISLKINSTVYNEKKLNELKNDCKTTSNVGAYAGIVKEKSIQRRLLGLTDNNTKNIKYLLSSFFEELGAEIRLTEISVNYLESIYLEVGKALLDHINCLQVIEDTLNVHDDNVNDYLSTCDKV